MGIDIDVEKSSWDRFSNAVKKIMDVKDDIVDNEFVELAMDTSGVIKFARNVSKYITQKKFERFLRGFNSGELPTEEQIEKLEKYVANEARAEFISESFAKVLLSKSTKACVLMGIILSGIVENERDVSHWEMISMNALLNLYDIDLVNFKLISEFIEQSPEERASLNGEQFKQFLEINNSNGADVSLTIEKGITLQILSKEIIAESVFHGDVYLREYLKVTDPGKILYNLINEFLKESI